MPISFGKYQLIKRNFQSALPVLYIGTDFRCFEEKSSIFNNVSNSFFGQENIIKPHTSLYSKEILPSTKSQQNILMRKQIIAL